MSEREERDDQGAADGGRGVIGGPPVRFPTALGADGRKDPCGTECKALVSLGGGGCH